MFGGCEYCEYANMYAATGTATTIDRPTDGNGSYVCT